jgi:hypothetical protein
MMDIHAHNSAERARQCWEAKVAEVRGLIDQGNQAARRAQQDPRAQALLKMGMPPEVIIGTLMEADEVPVPTPAPRDLPAVGRAPVADTGPTGFYL